jgi:hypothetical protein
MSTRCSRGAAAEAPDAVEVKLVADDRTNSVLMQR